jgi:acyl-CoA synthetase (AMP-forming)/AMP-acid ligase II
MNSMQEELTRPELAERILSGGACLGDTPISALRPDVDTRLRALRQNGVRAGSVIAVEEGEAARFLATVLATWALDAVPLPCSATETSPYSERAYTVSRDERTRPPTDPRPLGGLDQTAVLHVTSGTTGEPSLTRRSCASVTNETEGYRQGLLQGRNERVYVPIPLAHSFGWGVALAALLTGARLDATPLVHAGRAAARLEAATVAALTAPVASLLAAVPGLPGAQSELRVAMVGASRVTAPIDDAFHARFGVRLSRNYGSSETGPTFMGAAGLPEGYIGRPMHGVSVLAPELGHEGELILSLPPVEGHIGADGPPGTAWATGDLVRRDADGTVAFLSRLRTAARLNDRSIDLHGLERMLCAVAKVEDVYPIILPRPGGESDDLYAVVAGTGVDRQSIERLRRRFPDGTQAVRLVYCDSLPLTATGKADRTQVIDLVQAHGGH